ncbi:MAG: hypothetical protein CMJ26_03215 [Phycisphaerae bacterium]|nr:hypothetical protein [Phycisphaerae bacterium]|tara:strand:- start:3412 stop:4443 length:1032 start_codon:yes stop_codon:yes gene_type:complete
MKMPPIIIHVPKTGGTTLFMILSGAQKPPVANYLYRHVIMNDSGNDMYSNCGDIFDSDSKEKYAQQKIVLMLREPLERLESEFGFLGNRETFQKLWKIKNASRFPKKFEDYVTHPCTSNSICKFLLGHGLYGNAHITDSDYDRIVRSLNELNFIYGDTKEMSLTIQNVSHICSIPLNNIDELPKYRVSLYKQQRGKDWDSIKEQFQKLNYYDMKLFNELSERFKKQIDNLPSIREITFKGDIYDSIYLFLSGTGLRSPLEIYISDVDNQEAAYEWISARKNELDQLTKDLMNQCNGEGKRFIKSWLEESIPTLLDKNNNLQIDQHDPLTTLRELTVRLFNSSA